MELIPEKIRVKTKAAGLSANLQAATEFFGKNPVPGRPRVNAILSGLYSIEVRLKLEVLNGNRRPQGN